MKLLTGLLAAVLLLAGAGACNATVRIVNDRGGQIGTYIDRYEHLRHSGQTVIIDGLCASVIAQSDGIRAGSENFVVDRACDSEAGVGGVLAIDDREIDPPATDATRKMGPNGLTPSPSDDVSHEQNTHARLLGTMICLCH